MFYLLQLAVVFPRKECLWSADMKQCGGERDVMMSRRLKRRKRISELMDAFSCAILDDTTNAYIQSACIINSDTFKL